jgi:ribosomal protein L15
MAVATAIKLGLKKGKKLLKGAKSGLKKITQAQRAGKTPTGGRGAAGRKTRRATTTKKNSSKTS